MSLCSLRVSSLCLAVLAATSAFAADPGRLGQELTPSGAEKAASKDGSIPAWAGTNAAKLESGWSYGKFRGDAWVHKGEKPLYTIDASNADK